jgi:hypothetical protein
MGNQFPSGIEATVCAALHTHWLHMWLSNPTELALLHTWSTYVIIYLKGLAGLVGWSIDKIMFRIRACFAGSVGWSIDKSLFRERARKGGVGGSWRIGMRRGVQ